MSKMTAVELLDKLIAAEGEYRDILAKDPNDVSEELCDAGQVANEIEAQLRTRLASLESDRKVLEWVADNVCQLYIADVMLGENNPVFNARFRNKPSVDAVWHDTPLAALRDLHEKAHP